MNLLSFDAVTPTASVAVSVDGLLAGSKSWLAGRNHSTELPANIRILLESCNIRPPDLDAVVVGTGPGSYTGIRIGLAFAKGMAMATGSTLVGISSLEAIAFAHAAFEGPICAMAALGPRWAAIGVFHGPATAWERVTEDRPLPAEELDGELTRILPRTALICGWGTHFHRSAPGWTHAPTTPPAACLDELGTRYLQAGGLDQLETVAPNYLRRSTPEERADAGRNTSEIPG